jgi:hypothetical protein
MSHAGLLMTVFNAMSNISAMSGDELEALFSCVLSVEANLIDRDVSNKMISLACWYRDYSEKCGKIRRINRKGGR